MPLEISSTQYDCAYSSIEEEDKESKYIKNTESNTYCLKILDLNEKNNLTNKVKNEDNINKLTNKNETTRLGTIYKFGSKCINSIGSTLLKTSRVINDYCFPNNDDSENNDSSNITLDEEDEIFELCPEYFEDCSSEVALDIGSIENSLNLDVVANKYDLVEENEGARGFMKSAFYGFVNGLSTGCRFTLDTFQSCMGLLGKSCLQSELDKNLDKYNLSIKKLLNLYYYSYYSHLQHNEEEAKETQKHLLILINNTLTFEGGREGFFREIFQLILPYLKNTISEILPYLKNTISENSSEINNLLFEERKHLFNLLEYLKIFSDTHMKIIKNANSLQEILENFKDALKDRVSIYYVLRNNFFVRSSLYYLNIAFGISKIHFNILMTDLFLRDYISVNTDNVAILVKNKNRYVLRLYFID